MEIKPMLLTETWDKSVLNDTTKYFQIKYNGVRALVHIKDSKVVGIRNRSNAPILYQFPEFRDIAFNISSGILDCEICVFKEDKSIFYSGVDKRRSSPSASVLRDYPAEIVVFDALQVDGETLVMKPYKYRYGKISPISAPKVRVAKNYGPELWKEVVERDLEGVVIKNPNAIYEIDKRSKEYLKYKNYKLAQIVVDKVEPNEKGTKVYAKFGEIEVEAQLAGIFDVEVNSTHWIKYLDIYGNRMIQPTKVNRTQVEAI